MSVTAARGFVAAGTACGVKADGTPDLALIATADHRPVPAAATFTTNRFAAAPVELCRRHLAATGGRATAIICNSGNANAGTGDRGRSDAAATARAVGAAVGRPAEEVLVCSTGLIGIPLPVERITGAVHTLVGALSPRGSEDAARAILTTDTRTKQVVVPGDGFVVGGIAKGAAMLAPHMATMLAFLTTDADVDPAGLRRALVPAVEESFNVLTVDGAMSTNDTVIVMASGLGRRPPEGELAEALGEACRSLMLQMAHDAEGHTVVVHVRVTGAAHPDEARHAARRVAECQLIKCSWYGDDPYWGRILAEVGASGVAFDVARSTVAYGPHVVARGGVAAPCDHDALAAYMARPEIDLIIDLGVGEAAGGVVTVDLTHEYVTENMGTS